VAGVAPPVPPRLVPVSDTDVLGGFCYVCNTSIDADVEAHFDQEHKAPATKPKVPIMTWEHRLRNVMSELQEVQEDGDRDRQISLIDNVLQELYLVRAKLAQEKSTTPQRVKEGRHGRS
jgi:hypothetical protein